MHEHMTFGALIPYGLVLLMKITGLIKFVDEKYPSVEFWEWFVITRLMLIVAIFAINYLLDSLFKKWRNISSEVSDNQKLNRGFARSVIQTAMVVIALFVIVEILLRVFSGTQGFYF